MPLRVPRFSLLVAALVLFTAIPSFAEFYTDWLWFRELGFEQVFLKSLSAQATTGLAVGAVVLAVLWLNLRLSLRHLRRREFAIATPEGPRVIRPPVEGSKTSKVAPLLLSTQAPPMNIFCGLSRNRRVASLTPY